MDMTKRRFIVELGERKAIQAISMEFPVDVAEYFKPRAHLRTGVLKLGVAVLVPTVIDGKSAYVPIGCELEISEAQRLAIIAVLQGIGPGHVSNSEKENDDDRPGKDPAEKDSQRQGAPALETHFGDSGNRRPRKADAKPDPLR